MPVFLVTTVIAVFVLSGCAPIGHQHPKTPPPPQPISLIDGVKEVMNALDELAKRPVNAPIHGLMPAEVEVVFQVQAQRINQNSMAINVVPLNILGAGLERSTEVTRSEGNTITIRFRNIVFATKEQLIGIKSADKLTHLVKALRNAGWSSPVLVK